MPIITNLSDIPPIGKLPFRVNMLLSGINLSNGLTSARVEQERLGSKIMDIKKLPSDNVFKSLKAKTSDKFLERAESNIILFKENAYNEPNFLKKQGELAFAGLGSAGLTLASIPLRPVKTAKEVGQMVIHPIKTIKGLGEEFIKNPVGTSVEFYVTGKGLHEISKPIKYVEPIEKLRRESFIRKQPKELQPVTRAILESEKAQRGIVPVSLKEIKNVNLKDIQNLKGIEPKLFEKTVREEKGIIFGSKAARVLSGGETRLPKDLDVAVKDVKGFNKAFYENIPTKIKQDINIKNQKIIRLEDKSTLADVKPLERLIPDKSILTRKGSLPIGGISDKLVIMGKGKPFLSFKPKVIENLYDIPTQRFKNVEGLKFVSFSEQTSRKAAGSLQYILEKNIKRQKDLPDYIKYLEIQKKSLSKSELLNKDVKLKKLDKSLDVLKKESKKIKIKGDIKNIEKVKESKLPSKLPSYLPKTKISNIPSNIKGKTSFIPSKISSKLQPSRLNKVSKLNSIIPSNMKISSLSLSSIPSFSNISTLSNLNNSSLTNSNISNLSSLSNMPTSALSSFPKKSVKLPKIIDVNIFSRKIESFNRRKKKKGKSKRKVYFTPTLIGLGKQPKGLKNLFYIGGEAR